MARLPTIEDFGRRPIAQPQRGIARVSNAGAVGDAMTDLGGTVANVGDLIYDREATAAAKERDTYVSDQIRELLYNPENGFMGKQGRVAVTDRQAALDRLREIEEAAKRNLSRGASRKLADAVQRRMDGARQSIDTHTMSARSSWLQGASEARVTAAMNDAIFDPAQTAEALAVVDSEIDERARLEGWGPEQTTLARDRARSGVYRAQIERLAAVDPVAAMGQMEQRRGEMLGADVAALEARLIPEVRRYRGRQAGAAAYQSGKTREAMASPAAQELMSGLISRGLPQHIASAFVMNMFDESGLDPAINEIAPIVDGSRGGFGLLQWTGPRRRALEAFAAARGTQVSDKDTQLDFLMAELRGSESRAGAAIMAASNTGEAAQVIVREFLRPLPEHQERRAARYAATDLDALVQIADPDERAAALEEFDLLASVDAGRQKKARAEAEEAAFSWIEAGNSVDDLPYDFRVNLGREEMNGLRSYQKSLAAGDTIATDWQTYSDLMEEYATDPRAFAARSPATYRGLLSDTDFKKMVDLRSGVLEGRKAPEITGVMSMADASLRAAGITKNDNPAAYGQFQSEMIGWMDANPDQASDPVALQARINQRLAVITFDPWGPMNRTETPAFAVDFDGDPLDPDDDMTLQDVARRLTQINGQKVKSSTIEAFVAAFTARFDRPPSPQELLEGMTASGLYN